MVLGMAGSALVLRVRDQILNVDRALKFPRPSSRRLLKERLAYVLTNEMDHLIRLTHPYVMPYASPGEESPSAASTSRTT